MNIIEKKFTSESVADTENVAAEIAAEALKCGCICLTGTMGAGKTAFTMGLVRKLAPECIGLVHSPTFAIVNEYIGKTARIFHFDLYRIKSAEDLYSTGFYDYEERGGLIVAEWSNMFSDCFPASAMHVNIAVTGESTRIITVTYGG